MRPYAILTRVGVLMAAGAVAFALPAASEPPQESGKSSHQAEAEGGNLVIWKLANFILLAGVGGWFIAKKGRGYFASRTQQIRRGIAEAAALRKEAEARYAEMEQRLANLGVEIESLRSQAHQESAAEGERLRRQREQDLKRVLTQAEQEISAAAKDARRELRAYSAELAVRLAEQKLRERMTPEADGALVASVVGELGQRFQDQAVRAS